NRLCQARGPESCPPQIARLAQASSTRQRKNMHNRKKWLGHRRYDQVERGSSGHRHERAMERPGQACQPARVLRMNWRAASIQDCRRRWTERRRRNGMYQSAEPLGGFSNCKLLVDAESETDRIVGPVCSEL